MYYNRLTLIFVFCTSVRGCPGTERESGRAARSQLLAMAARYLSVYEFKAAALLTANVLFVCLFV